MKRLNVESLRERPESLRNRILRAWARGVTARPWTVLIVSALLAGVSIWLTVTRLQFLADRSDMIDRTLAWQQRYSQYEKQFPNSNDAIVAIDSSASDATTMEGYVAALEARLRADPSFSAVNAGFPTSEAPAGLLLGEPLARVKSVVDQLRRSGPVLATRSLSQLIGLSLLAPNMSAADREELASLLRRVSEAGRSDDGKTSILGLPGPDSMQRFTTASGKLTVIMVSLKQAGAAAGGDDVNTLARPISALRGHVLALLGEARFKGLEAGVTGVPVLEADESAQAIRDSAKATALSLVLISALMFITYRGVVIPLLALVSLLLGVAWSFGWLVLTVGHLQLLSSVFAAMLLGLGIDNAIHLIARLELVHPDHERMPTAVEAAFVAVGPGIITSALTVAAAFLVMLFTKFRGVGEMGLIAAGGVILCAISVMSCFPALLEVIPHPERRLRSRAGGVSQPFMRGWVNVVDRRPRLFLALSAAVFGLFAWVGMSVRYDPDLMKLLPENIESAVWEKRLTQDDQQSAWHAVVMAKDEAEARRLTEALRKTPHVAEVTAIGTLFPAQLEAKQKLLSSLPDPGPIAGAEAASPEPADPRPAASALSTKWRGKDEAIASAAAGVAAMDDAQAVRAEAAFARDQAKLKIALRELRGAQPATPAQLPAALREQYIGRDGSLLLRIYPEAPANGGGVLAPENLNPFVEAVLATAPSATGPAVQIYESTKVIGHAYLIAGIYSLAAILLLLIIDFRNIADAVCAMIPVVIGTALLAGMMRLADVSLNFANMIVLPLIVGLGVSAGVHAVNRWKQQPDDPPAGLAGGSGRAITLTTLTTVFGFACMMIAQHRGIRSLGFVMSAGLILVWCATVFCLPGALRMRTILRERRAARA